MVADGHEIASHHYRLVLSVHALNPTLQKRWVDYATLTEEQERHHVHASIAAIKAASGKAPIVFEEYEKMGLELLYDSDAYNDELPYYLDVSTISKPNAKHLVIPYTLDANDMKFCVPPGFSSPDGFYTYLKNTFDILYEEGRTQPKFMNVGLHCRLVGKPGRAAALKQFMDYGLSS
ncbi:hypothetical protein HDU84_004996 [Entophlyctis sp. JEL0112]|nr:hypothetical protein HDU84_004996 [Entophlyctis sp. JEL0112]